MTRVAVVGAGMVGATTAARIAEARLCDHVALIDVAGDLARAMALDIGSSLPLLGSDTTLTGGESYDGASGADVVVITAGRPRQPGPEPRRPARGQRPHRRGGLRRGPRGRARRRRDRRHEPARRDDDARPGRARLPARARRRHGRACSTPRASATSWPSAPGAPASTVEALTLGSHGDTMVPLSRTATIGGRPAGEVLGDAALERGRPAHARRRRRGRAAAAARIGLLGAERRGDADGARDPARRAGRAADRRAPVGPVRHRGRLRRRAGAARSRAASRRSSRPGSTRPRSRRCGPLRRRCAAAWPICTTWDSCGARPRHLRPISSRPRRSPMRCATRCSETPSVVTMW